MLCVCVFDLGFGVKCEFIMLYCYFWFFVEVVDLIMLRVVVFFYVNDIRYIISMGMDLFSGYMVGLVVDFFF